MDLAHPIRGIIPTLDAAVLETLAGTSGPLSGHHVYSLAGTGSARGVRLVLARLVTQGLVVADEHPGVTLYQANRKHLAWPAIEALVGLRGALIEALRERVTAWEITPLHASIFGSMARGDADEGSDLDLLLVRLPGRDEEWEAQLDALRKWVLEATGNRCQAFDVDADRFDEHVAAGDPLVAAWRRDGIHLAGTAIESLVRAARRRQP